MRALIVALCLLAAPALAGPLDFAGGFSGATERIFRGYSVTGGNPGADIWATLAYDGAYVGVAAGNRSKLATGAEYDVSGTAGYRRAFGPITLDGSATYMTYGGTGSSPFHNWEGRIAAHGDLGGFGTTVAGVYATGFLGGMGDYWRVEGGIESPDVQIAGLDAAIFGQGGHTLSDFGDWQDYKAGLKAQRGAIFARAYYAWADDHPLPAYSSDRLVFEIGALIE